MSGAVWRARRLLITDDAGITPGITDEPGRLIDAPAVTTNEPDGAYRTVIPLDPADAGIVKALQRLGRDMLTEPAPKRLLDALHDRRR